MENNKKIYNETRAILHPPAAAAFLSLICLFSLSSLFFIDPDLASPKSGSNAEMKIIINTGSFHYVTMLPLHVWTESEYMPSIVPFLGSTLHILI